MSAPRLFAVTIPGYGDTFTLVIATSAAKARYRAWISINDVVPVRLIDLNVRRFKDAVPEGKQVVSA